MLTVSCLAFPNSALSLPCLSQIFQWFPIAYKIQVEPSGMAYEPRRIGAPPTLPADLPPHLQHTTGASAAVESPSYLNPCPLMGCFVFPKTHCFLLGTQHPCGEAHEQSDVVLSQAWPVKIPTHPLHSLLARPSAAWERLQGPRGGQSHNIRCHTSKQDVERA